MAEEVFERSWVGRGIIHRTLQYFFLGHRNVVFDLLYHVSDDITHGNTHVDVVTYIVIMTNL